jgi:hypothetical protein
MVPVPGLPAEEFHIPELLFADSVSVHPITSLYNNYIMEPKKVQYFHRAFLYNLEMLDMQAF